jgi:two-component system response regulator
MSAQDDIAEILLVEDSQADGEMTLRSLKRSNLANKVVWLRDGVEALDYIFRRGPYELREGGHPRMVMLDIKMPRMDGIEVLRAIKADAGTRSIPVVMLTSSAEDRDLRRCYDLGVNSYLIKPVDFASFASVVAQVGMYWMILNTVPEG